MPICLVQIYLLKLTGRRQENIGIAGSFSYEKFMDDSKQLFACQPGSNFPSVRSGGGRVCIVNIERVHRRICLTWKKGTEAVHVQCKRGGGVAGLISMGKPSLCLLQPYLFAKHAPTTRAPS